MVCQSRGVYQNIRIISNGITQENTGDKSPERLANTVFMKYLHLSFRENSGKVRRKKSAFASLSGILTLEIKEKPRKIREQKPLNQADLLVL